MHYFYFFMYSGILLTFCACQDPPLEPPKNDRPSAMLNGEPQPLPTMIEMSAGDSTIAGDDLISGEMYNGGQQDPTDMGIDSVQDMLLEPSLDLNVSDLSLPTEPDMIPPIELPASCNGALDLPLADCRPDPLPTTGDLYEDCVRRINQLRAVCQCLPPLERWYDGEACADQHAEYDADLNQAHSGFREGICSPAGRGQNECPGYQSNQQVISLCLQQMWDEGPGEPFIEHGHYINMTNPSHQRVACGFFTTEQGRVWAIQNFSP